MAAKLMCSAWQRWHRHNTPAVSIGRTSGEFCVLDDAFNIAFNDPWTARHSQPTSLDGGCVGATAGLRNESRTNMTAPRQIAESATLNAGQ